MSRQSMDDIIRDAKQELRERLEGDDWTDEPHDIIHEIADGQIPVYTSHLMELAAEDINLATNEPELGPAFDGSPTPVNIIAANVFEAIEAALWEEHRAMVEEHEDDDTEDEDE